MSPQKSKEFDGRLTSTELELMNILWQIQEGSVGDVIAKLPQHRDLAYTSVSTILRILQQKSVLKTRKEGRGHIYIPLITKASYESRTIKDVVDRVFQGTPVDLVKQLLNSVEIKPNEIDEIRKLLENRNGKK